jgi:transposase
MNKSSFFSGQPILGQLIGLIPEALITKLVGLHNSDRYYKSFKSRDHLISMLYACFHACTSLREVTTGLEASYNKLRHLGIKTIPRRSTLSDANSQRAIGFFEDLYKELYELYYGRLPDSRPGRSIESRLFIMDSTTVTLFSEIMKGVGGYGVDGRRKGGVKAHVVLNAKQNIPQLIYITEGARNDKVVMGHVRLNKGDILVFDKGYHHFAQWDQWTTQEVTWVTRLTENEVFNIVRGKIVPESHQQEGVCRDIEVLLGAGTGPSTKIIRARIVGYYVKSHNKIYHFLTNNFRFKPANIADIYRKRWQVEMFFKRFKQTNPVRYFLGDNENAIRIQLWCAFIKDLLVKVVKDQLRRKWSFSNISSMIRLHLMNYIDLKKFLNNPDKIKAALFTVSNQAPQLRLFPT